MLKISRIAIALSLLYASSSFGQDLDSLLNLNAFTQESELQKILNKNVAVSSKNGLTTRETPGIITLITSEEIQNERTRPGWPGYLAIEQKLS